MSTQIPNLKEKVGTVLAYLTLGVWGFVWLLISRKHYYEQKNFIRFHCFQSIFVGILYMFIPQGLGILFSLLVQIFTFIPGADFITNTLHIIHGILQTMVKYGSLCLIIYCVIFCLYGKYTNIPWISQSINRMLR